MYSSSELCFGPISSRKKQAGAALLVILLLLISAASFLFVKNLNRGIGFRSEDAMATANALAQAKAALIGRALTDNSRPGSLPCPDLMTNIPGTNIPNDGRADLLAGNDCPNYVGRLPWYTLRLGDLRDGDGERLWYGLTTTLRDDTSAQPINSATPGQLTVDGTIADIVAVIISPGSAVSNPPAIDQQRNAGPNDVTNYLEDNNSDGDANFVTTAAGDFNDRVAYISRQELMQLVEKRVLGEARQILRAYYGPPNSYAYYPLAAPLGSSAPNQIGQSAPAPLRRGFLPLDGPAPGEQPLTAFPPWFRTNQWDNHIYYALAPACTLADPSCSGSGFLNVGGVSNVQALLISAGDTLPGQTRPPTPIPPPTASDYLDSVENNNMDDIYDAVGTQITPSYNDQMKIVAP